MIIRINPLDTFFFRDGKPFEMGDESWADGVFPPSPSVIYGALRSSIAIENNIPFSDIENLLADFELANIYYWVNDTHNKEILGGYHFPLPFDLVEAKIKFPVRDLENLEEKKAADEKEKQEKEREKIAKTYQVEKLSLIERPAFSNTNTILRQVLTSNKQVENVKNGLLNKDQLERYLLGDLKTDKIRKVKDWLKYEAKIGIGRDKQTKSVDEGKLYRVDMMRLTDIDIIVEFKNLKDFKFSDNGLLKLGGEGKVASFKKISERSAYRFDENKIKFNSETKFKVYLATPAIFNNGWLPNITKKLGFDAKLISACVDKPMNIGGFDMLRKQPKNMFKAVPAGSVYYYETDKENLKLLNDKQGISVSDELSKQGFGIAYFGNI